MVREVTSPSWPQSSLANRSKSCFLLRCRCIFGNARSGTRTHSYKSPRTQRYNNSSDRNQFHYHLPQSLIYTTWHSVSTNSTIRGKTGLLCPFLGFSSLLSSSLPTLSHDRILHTEHRCGPPVNGSASCKSLATNSGKMGKPIRVLSAPTRSGTHRNLSQDCHFSSFPSLAQPVKACQML